MLEGVACEESIAAIAVPGRLFLGDDASVSLLMFPTVMVAVQEMLRPINPE